MPKELKKFVFRDLFASEEAYQNRNNPIHFERWKERQEEAKKAQEAADAKEAARIARIKCPSCKSDKKERFERRDDNGIIGPGYSSWVVEAYWICKKCGTHYSK